MKTPGSRQACPGVVGEQLALIDPPAFCPVWPKPATLQNRALEMLLDGRRITSPDFQKATRSWRLAAYVRNLREDGWPIHAAEVTFGDEPTRCIALYWLQDWAIQQVGGRHHG